MAYNLILGIGGTGAKVVESFIHLCATGLGPSNASVAFIDQDRANGNTHRSRTTLGQYMAARAALPEERNPVCDLLRTTLEPHSPGNDDERSALDACHWKPQGTKNSLEQLIEYHSRTDKVKDLANALFRREEELRMNLDRGYRGRPHVGSAALLLELKRESDGFWASVERKVSGETNEVRIFLCGSAFGGTGAAILPTLARRLRNLNKQSLRTGASLMLPYFSFVDPDDQENAVRSHELLPQSRSALKYYHTDIDRSDGKDTPYSFDDLYLVGWDPLIPLNYNSVGSETQANPALVPELYGALAAAEFFADKDAGRTGGTKNTKLHIICRREQSKVTWADLPPVPNRPSVPESYATWLRFCTFWHFIYSRGFAADDPADEAWFRRHVGAAEVANNKVKAFGEYVATALRYAAAMSRFSRFDTEAPLLRTLERQADCDSR